MQSRHLFSCRTEWVPEGSVQYPETRPHDLRNHFRLTFGLRVPCAYRVSLDRWIAWGRTGPCCSWCATIPESAMDPRVVEFCRRMPFLSTVCSKLPSRAYNADLGVRWTAWTAPFSSVIHSIELRQGSGDFTCSSFSLECSRRNESAEW